MTREEAEWVRAHAWTRGLRFYLAQTGDEVGQCPCQQRGMFFCHDNAGCSGMPEPETCIRAKDGALVSFLKAGRDGPDVRYVHPTPGRGGGYRSAWAQVWLADRVCVQRCGCQTRRADADQPHLEPMSDQVGQI